MKKSILLILVFCLFCPVIGSATTFSTLTETVGYADMDGMTVIVEYGNGDTDIQTWGVTGANTSGASGTDWSLTFTGNDTYAMMSGDLWKFNSSISDSSLQGIASITIDAASAGVAFDIIWGKDSTEWYTEGSYFGYWEANGIGLDPIDPNAMGTNTGTYSFGSTGIPGSSGYVEGYEALWTFSDPVDVAGVGLPVGSPQDVYGSLKIDFTAENLERINFTFGLDTDVVPEPTTMLLFGLGLLGFTAVSRKKQMA